MIFEPHVKKCSKIPQSVLKMLVEAAKFFFRGIASRERRWIWEPYRATQLAAVAVVFGKAGIFIRHAYVPISFAV